jgi:hypothetical protein
MRDLLKDYFTLTDEDKFNRVKTISLSLFERYIDTSSEYHFNASLTMLLEHIDQDIKHAERIEDYEVCEVGKRLYNIFSELTY